MKPRITVLTIGVDDLERALTFYRDGMGLATDGIFGTEFEHGAVAFLSPGVWANSRHLASRKSGVGDWSTANAAERRRVYDRSQLNTREEVDQVMAQAESGAQIL
jgi:uncharacterized protein